MRISDFKPSYLLVLKLIILVSLTACSGSRPQPADTPTSLPFTSEPDLIPTPTLKVGNSAITSTAETTPAEPTNTGARNPDASTPEFSIQIGDSLPSELIQYIETVIRDKPVQFGIEEDPGRDDQAVINIKQNGQRPLAEWIYTAASPFATTADQVTMEAIREGWQSGVNDLGQLILDSETADVFTTTWGPPSNAVWIVQPSEISSALWAGRPSWTLMPVHQLTPEIKVLKVDGISPLDKDFERSKWPLVVSFGASGDIVGQDKLQESWDFPKTNFNPDLLTSVAMSGVTALGRATAYQMEIQGVTVPGKDIGPYMIAADISHVSHEVPFAPDCPYPNPVGDPIFCARDKYMDLLLSIGVDVVELTGNHVNDWGVDNFIYTLDLYREAGLELFGGGRNLVEAAEPAQFEHNSNKIAFVGCNVAGPPFAWATEERAGSRPCDLPAFYDQIRALKEDGYLVIATLQYYEFYQYSATAEQRVDFRLVAEAGAAAVSGSQGHHAQGFDFYNGAFIHHGLGNLFFDQMDMLGTRQSFIDIYTIYDGRLLNVELVTSLIENYCCPRLMTPEERNQLLETVFQASGW
ncbi:MAG: hypothetical protein BMS9Abin02_1000 [Anaerolineae bacterium]|nr:MAG: hypothetical protein BMS9Abin02_1000 [Anaerolineae bacterium]